MSLDPRLLEHCANESQRTKLQAVIDHGGYRTAARALGVNFSTVYETVQVVKRRASTQGLAPGHPGWSRPVPETHVAKGVSVFHPAEVERDAKGKVTRVVEPAAWVKADLRQEAYNALVRGAVQAFLEDVPKIAVAPEPVDVQNDVIPWIQIGDAHIGMLAHAAEANENFDLKIAEAELCGAVAKLIDEMPPCERIVLNDLGDFTHYDNITATTAASGHPLDADGRHSKMLRVYVRTMRFIVERALTKARHLDVLINQGNHSRINDFWIRELLVAAYGHTDRVHVLDNDNVFLAYRMGKTLVMVHHSDKCPPQRLVGVMTTDFREDYGQTEFHYIDTGHVHHKFVSKEHPGIVIESWNHLAANDKWAHEAGYRSRKAITVVLRSRTYGEVGRRVLPIEAVRAHIGRVVEKRPAYAV